MIDPLLTPIDLSDTPGIKWAKLQRWVALLANNIASSGGGLPSQGGNAGFFLTTNGTTASWAAITASVNLTAYSVLANTTGSTALGVSSQSIVLGAPRFSDTGILGQFTSSVVGYYQSLLQNTSNNATASADIIVANDQGTATTHYGDFGINSSTFTGTGSLALAGATYLYSQTGDLVLGTNTSNAIHFVVNNGATDAASISAAGTFNIPTLTVTTINGVTVPVTTDTVALLGTAQTFTATNQFSNATPIQLTSAATNGLQLYSTADQVTNFSRVSLLNVVGTFKLISDQGGSGTAQPMRVEQLGGGANTFMTLNSGDTTANVRFSSTSRSSALIFALIVPGINTSTSGTSVCLSLTPTYNQSASTASNTALNVAATETALGTGTQLLASFAGGSSGTTKVLTIGSPTFGALTTASGVGLTLPAATYTVTGTTTVATMAGFYQGATTFTNAGAGTITDAFLTLQSGPTVAAGSQVITRNHTLGVIDSTSAASSITGGFIVATTLGTTATSVGIGGGNVNAGGLITGGTITSTGLFTASSTSTFTGATTHNNAVIINGATASTALTLTNTARTSGVLPYIKWTIPTDTSLTLSTEAPGLLTVTGTRQWATGALALQRENLFVGPTIAFVGASTLTDGFTMGITPVIQGTNATITRAHSLGILGSNSATTSITGELIVAATFGTAATSTGIGNGNVVTGANLFAATSTGRVGYATGTGAGSAVTQLTSRTTGVTINTPTGAITLFAAAGSATATTFTVTCSSVAAVDTVIVNQVSGSNLYMMFVTAVAAGSFNITFLTTGGTTSDSPVFNYSVIKGSST